MSYNKCPDCRNEFVQPFVCTTCGAQKLYDETVRSLEAENELRRAIELEKALRMADLVNLNEVPVSCNELRTIAETIERNGSWHIAALKVREAADKIEQLTAENARMREALTDAIEEVEMWAGYASDYFQDKHDLPGVLARLRSAL